MDFTVFFKEQALLHPSMQPQDAVKLCYQAAFGAEHLLSDLDAAQSHLFDELSAVPESEAALIEPISPDFCRVSLSAWKKQGLPHSWLFELFRMTATGGAAPNSSEVFSHGMQTVASLVERGEAPFSCPAWQNFRVLYDSQPPRAVHHSAIYREHERPAYRVVASGLAELIPLLVPLSELHRHAGTTVLAIDGRAAAGKSSLAAVLAEITGAGLIHMDDFFLPAELRTEERLSQPGGNVHYERFLQEALPQLSSGAAFSYQTYDCAAQQLGEHRQVCASPWRIVEGAYSCHPALGRYMRLSLFCDIPPDEQMQRIQKRNGPKMAAVFASRWIPLEERYFSAHQIAEGADVVLGISAD